MQMAFAENFTESVIEKEFFLLGKIQKFLLLFAENLLRITNLQVTETEIE